MDVDSRGQGRSSAFGSQGADLIDSRDCRCGGTGHTALGDPCDGPKGDGCWLIAENREFALSLLALTEGS